MYLSDNAGRRAELHVVSQQLLPAPYLESKPPLIVHGHRTFKAEPASNAAHLLPGDRAPVLVRFAQFPKINYRNNIGRDGADLVFVNHYGELAKLGLSVAEAASYSGRSIRSWDAASDVFIWVMFAKTNRDAIPATWHKLLGYIADEADQVNPPFASLH